MKIRQIAGLLLVAILLSVATWVVARSVTSTGVVTENVMYEQPRTVMNEARKRLDKALKTGDSQRLITALIQESVAQLIIDEDSIATVVDHISQVVASVDNEVDKSVLRLFWADVYMRYYANHSYQIAHRDYVVGNNDITTWSRRDFQQAIDSLLTLAVTPSQSLQEMPVSRYEKVMLIDDAALSKELAWNKVCRFMPTMYDFVVSRAIEIYSSLAGYGSNRIDRTPCKECYAPVTMLMAEDVIPAAGDARVWQLYRDVLAFHSSKAHDEALFMWNLQRIEYAYRVAPDVALYRDALAQIIDTYRSRDYVIEAVMLWADVMVMSDDYSSLKQLYDELREWIARYPSYYRTDCLRVRCKQMTDGYIDASHSTVVYPDTPVAVEVSYRNARQIDYELIHCEGILSTEDISSLSIERAKGEVVATGTLPLSDTLTFVTHRTRIELPPLAVGCYALVTSIDGQERSASFFVVTRYMTLSLNGSETGGQILAVDRQTGQPAVGVPVTIYAKNPLERVKAILTDSLGLCRFDIPAKGYYRAAVQTGEDVFSPVTTLYSAYEPQPIKGTHITLFTDRAIYRPAQTMMFAGIAYQANEDTRKVLADTEVFLSLRGANGEVLWSDTLTTDRYGSVHGECYLPDDVLTGMWLLSARGSFGVAQKWIEVSEYKRPQFSVVCNPVEGTYTYGDTVTVTGEARTYSGVSLSQATVTYSVVQAPLFYERRDASEVIASGTTTTDAQGNFSLSFLAESPLDGMQWWWRRGSGYRVQVTVTSSTGENQSDVTTVRISETPFYIDFSLPEMLHRDVAGKVSVTVKNYSDKVVNLPVQLALYPLHGDVIDMPIDSMQPAEKPVWSDNISAGETEITPPWSSFASGAYRMVARTTDAQGRTITEHANFVLYTLAETCPPVPTSLWLPEAEQTVAVGETARFAIGSSFQDASLLYMLFDGNKQIACRRIALDNSVVQIEIPYLPTYGSHLQVALVMVRDGKVYKGNGLAVNRREHDTRLIVTPETFRDKTLPGAQERWRFTVRNIDGKPVDALFMAELYDASLDALRRHEWSFTPRYNIYPRTVSWRSSWYQESSSSYIYVPNDRNEYFCHAIPSLQLNEYGLNSSWRGSNRLYYSMSNVAVKAAGVDNADMAVAEEMSMEADMRITASVLQTPEAEPEQAEIAYRQNLVETAFFYPHLVTDKEGRVAIEFTMPEVNTTWNFFSLAVTPTLLNGAYDAQVITSKPLMVSPNLPRFVRQGDCMVLAVAIQNTTDAALSGEARMTLYQPDTEREIAVVATPFEVAATATATVRLAVDVPDTLTVVGVRVGATTSLYADGEQQLIAVLPATQMVTESMPFYLAPSVADTVMTFASMVQQMSRPTLRNYRATLEYCDNPVWYAVAALPVLAEPSSNTPLAILASLYANTVAHGIVSQNKQIADVLQQWASRMEQGETPVTLYSQLEQNEELKQLLLQQTPWVLDATDDTERMQQLATLLDAERANEMCNQTVSLLQKAQQPDGGWAWYEGMPTSFFITLNIVEGLSRLADWGETSHDEAIAMMQNKALRYLDTEVVRRNKQTPKVIGYDELCYLYVRSNYMDIPLAGATLTLHKQLVALLANQWSKYDDIEKAYAAIVLHRHGYKKEAQAIVGSLREYAITTATQGMYWRNNRVSYRNSAIQVHCAIYNAFAEIDPKPAELDAMRQWLLLQKQTQNWGNVPSTLDAVSLLLTSGSNWVAKGNDAQLTWGDTPLAQSVEAEAVMGYEKYQREGDSITTADATVSVSHHVAHPSWGALYWQYYDKMSEIEARGSEPISVAREYYVMCQGEWMPVGTTTLHAGDRVMVRMVIYTDRDMQYMTLTDARPACFEPVEQLPSYECNDGTCYYREPTDAATSFYFDFLPRGTRVITYEVYVDRAGTYQTGIATFGSYYAPQYTAHSAGATFVVD